MKGKVLTDRYLQEGETEDGMYWRVAKAVAKGDDELASKFHCMMGDGLFLPNTPTLVNAGTDSGGLSACYVVPVEDNLDSIYEALVAQGHIHKSFGGTGFDFSTLRPKGASINSTGGTATGPVGFMKLFNCNAEAVRQGGKREGANMGILRVDHPDIEEFICCKEKEGELSHFNISVAITDVFMKAVCVAGDQFELISPITSGTYESCVNARELFNTICEHIWRNGEPGVVFIDEVNKHNQTPSLGKITATNPCGEQPLLPWESCNLGSINLAKFVGDLTIDDGPFVMWEGLANTVKLAVQFLNNVIDINKYPLEDIERASLLTRKIGLGVMGWHDMLVKMGIPYDSDNALRLAEEVIQHISTVAIDKSRHLAKSSSTFPTYDGSTWQHDDIPVRNATLTTIAPTGSLSIIAECSSGVEPVFAWKHIRKIESGEFEVKHPTYDEATAWDDKAMMDTAGDISPEAHIRMQAAFQKHVHNAVSKTINLPHDAIVQDIKDAIMLAWKLKCKGITMYRDGSRNEQVLNTIPEGVKKFMDEYTQPPMSVDTDQSTSHRVKHTRPKVLTGTTEKLVSGCGEMFVTVNMLDGAPYEVIIPRGSGGCQANMEAIGRLISLGLRSDISISDIVKQLNKVQCSNAIRSTKSEGDSCAQIIGGQLTKLTTTDTLVSGIKAKASEDMVIGDLIVVDPITRLAYKAPDNPTGVVYRVIDDKVSDDVVRAQATCPECGESLSFGEGCMNGSCPNCGWSGCL
jgi:ribonucleoside-diphosphate reductase alpha chain